MILLYAAISFFSGITVVLARMLNAKLAEKIGTIQATVVNYVVGIFFSILMLLLMQPGFSPVPLTNSLPFWSYLGGLLGIVIIMISNYITPRVPAFYITLLVFLGQLTLGILIDWWVSREFSPLKLLGSIFVVAGFLYNLLLDKNAEKEADKRPANNQS